MFSSHFKASLIMIMLWLLVFVSVSFILTVEANELFVIILGFGCIQCLVFTFSFPALSLFCFLHLSLSVGSLPGNGRRTWPGSSQSPINCGFLSVSDNSACFSLYKHQTLCFCDFSRCNRGAHLLYFVIFPWVSSAFCLLHFGFFPSWRVF